MENPFEIIDERLRDIEGMLRELIKVTNALCEKETTEDELFTIDETAKFLRLAKVTIYGYVQRREIPHSKLGKRLFFRKTELLEWIDKRKILTTEEIQQQVDSYILKRRRRK
jgi:excisionase family DNA binding protein